MKIQPRNADAFSRRPADGVRIVLVYGPDPGLARERAQNLARAVVPDLTDPFRIGELKPDQVSADPARLHDEMAAQALTGGRRLVRLRDADDGVTAGIQGLLKGLPPGDSLLLIEAGDLGKSSKLRSLVEDSEGAAAAIACYVESEEELAATIGRMLTDLGLSIDADAKLWLAGNLVGDRMMARGEIEKLAIYMQGQKSVSLADVRAVIGDSAALDLDEPALAAADGNLPEVDRSLRRLFADGIATVALLRSAQRHFQRLHIAVAAVSRGQSPQQAVKSLRPPVFFKAETQMVTQVRRWTLPLLNQALDRLMDAEADCKRSAMPDETICARAFFQLAQLARRG
jgi:DNA polymerase III subunit delta